MENKKYILTDETMEFNGHILHRIKAIKDFGAVKKDELGGWIESEYNLSQKDECWVRNEAKVYENAKVFYDAWVCNEALVHGHARIYDRARIHDYVEIFGNAEISGNADIYHSVKVYGYAEVKGNAKIGFSAKIYDYAEIFGNVRIGGNAEIYEDATLCDNVAVYDKARISGSVIVSGRAEIGGDVEIRLDKDYAVYKNSWSSGRYFTWTRSNNMWKVGCFYGSGEELIKKAYKDSEKSGKSYEIIVKTQEALSNVK